MDPVAALAPLLYFDAVEPFVPELAAVAVFAVEGPSPSFPGVVTPRGDVAIEYALWWPCEIEHCYELEHVWVHGVHAGASWAVTMVEGSAHGGRHLLNVELVSGRPVVFCEPGKHGTAASPQEILVPRDVIEWMCGPSAGRSGVCVTELFADRLFPTPVHHRQARRYLEQFSFMPSWDFSKVVDVAALDAVTFPELARSVPERVFSQLGGVARSPLGRSAGGLGDATDVAVVAMDPRSEPGALRTVDGLSFRTVLDQIRAEQRELVVTLGELSAACLGDLGKVLRRHWAVTATSLVCRDDVQRVAARATGAVVIMDCRARDPEPGDDWVWSADADPDRFRVMGPGGDIDYPADLPVTLS